MKILELSTNAHNYKINLNTQNFIVDGEESGSWKLVGFLKQEPFGRFLRISLSDFMNSEKLFKNGKGKFTVLDRDHGTVRFWISERICYANIEG